MKLKEIKLNYFALLGAAVALLFTIIAFWSGANIMVPAENGGHLVQAVPPDVMAHMYLPVNMVLAPVAAYFWVDKMVTTNDSPIAASIRVFFQGVILSLAVFFFAAAAPFLPALAVQIYHAAIIPLWNWAVSSI